MIITHQTNVPVITLDGPGGVGKGTIAQMLAKKLGWHFLDSGVLYRAIAWEAIQRNVDYQDESQVKNLLNSVQIETKALSDETTAVFCNNQDITAAIRTEACSQMASKLSALPMVRDALLDMQRAMRKPPGLVTDGRDMGTVIFPDATVKFFLTAEAEERAKRRFNQLKAKGISVSLREVYEELLARDERDQVRRIAPTKPAPNAVLIDTTHLSVSEVFDQVVKKLQEFNI